MDYFLFTLFQELVAYFLGNRYGESPYSLWIVIASSIIAILLCACLSLSALALFNR